MPQFLALRAVEMIRQGRKRCAVKLLEKAIKLIRTPPQRLPVWVKPGALVQWMGDEPHDVYRVRDVTPGKNWTFRATSVKDPQKLMSFRQERGKRYWRKYRESLP